MISFTRLSLPMLLLMLLAEPAGMSAQSVLSSRITDMLADVSRQVAEAQATDGKGMKLTDAGLECPVDTAAIQRTMVAHFNADGTVKTVGVIAQLREGATAPTALLEGHGISVDDIIDNMVCLTVPAAQLEFLETVEEFIALFPDEVYQPHNDSSRAVLNVSNINGIDSDTYTFDTPFTGKGVVVGVIDTGIDFNHIAFKDAEGNTRLKKAVCYGESGNPTIATTAEAIAALTWDSPTNDDKSHGTHVSASAAGSNLASTVEYSPYSRNLCGMAPEADLVLCGVYTLTSSRIMKAIQEITATAQELGEPCVINMSFGSTGQYWHNGKSANNSYISKHAAKGVVFCMSTGNDAMHNWTVDKTIAAGDYMTVIPIKTDSARSTSRSYVKGQTIKFYLPGCTSTSAVSYTLEVVDTLTGATSTLAATPLKRSGSSTSYTPSISFSRDDSNNKWVTGTLSLQQSYFEDNGKFLAIKLQNKTSAPLRIYAISAPGKGENGTYLDGFIYTDIPNYTYDPSTPDMSLNESCSAEDLISVGAYTNTRRVNLYYANSKGNAAGGYYPVETVGTENGTARFSSYGIDDYGKVHPDVIAPGVAIVSAFNYYDTEQVADIANKKWYTKDDSNSTLICAYLLDSNAKYNLWFVNNGTSMATPITTGIVALWMQACQEYAPEYGGLNAADVREIIKNTARTAVNGADITASSGNSVQMGYGLIDAEAGIQYIKDHFATAIQGITAKDEPQKQDVVKKFVNGRLVIEKDGRQYNAAGGLIEN